MLAQFAGDIAQISQRASLSPSVSHAPKRKQSALVQCSCARKISLLSGYVALLVEGPRASTVIPELLKDLHGFRKRHASAGVVTADFGDVSEVVQAAGDRN